MGDAVADELLLKAGSIEITTRIARFGDITYQVANIGSVAVYLQKRFNPIAVVLFLATVAMGIWAFNLNAQHAPDTQVVAGIAVTLAVAAFIVQSFWPKKLFTFVLKTSSNDVHKIVSEDGEHLSRLQSAIEGGFVHYAV
jgi:Family of unknown function (DUF6232)